MWEIGINSFLIKESDFFVPLSFQFTTEPLTLSVLAICGILVTMKPINGLTLHRVHCTASERIIGKLSLGFNTLPETYIFSSPEARYHISLILIYFQSTLCRVMQEGGGGGGGEQGVYNPLLPVPRSLGSSTIVALCLPTSALHGITPVFRLIKWIRNLGF